MKKICALLFVILIASFNTSCDYPNTLLLLNWGEYINEDLVTQFEEEYGARVIISIASSNELFYSKVKSNTTAYDLVIPSDYMIEKMYVNDLLQEIDYTKLTNYKEDIFLPGVYGIQNGMFEGNEKYNIPYFWGTFGLMYNKLNKPLYEKVQQNLLIEDDDDRDTAMWELIFKNNVVSGTVDVGMYDVPRFAYAAAMFYKDMSPNETSTEALNVAKNVLESKKFAEWGTDTLKKNVASDNLDIAFVYTGDFLDTVYVKQEEGIALDDMTFDIYIPNRTIAFMDSFVIPKMARHVDLAHKFINFFLRTEVAYENASIVGYCTPLKDSYDLILNGDDEEWATIMSRYYPLPQEDDEVKFKGTPLKDLPKDYLNKISTLVNNVKA
jgi:spermidine/putrescine-binding protein